MKAPFLSTLTLSPRLIRFWTIGGSSLKSPTCPASLTPRARSRRGFFRQAGLKSPSPSIVRGSGSPQTNKTPATSPTITPTRSSTPSASTAAPTFCKREVQNRAFRFPPSPSPTPIAFSASISTSATANSPRSAKKESWTTKQTKDAGRSVSRPTTSAPSATTSPRKTPAPPTPNWKPSPKPGRNTAGTAPSPRPSPKPKTASSDTSSAARPKTSSPATASAPPPSWSPRFTTTPAPSPWTPITSSPTKLKRITVRRRWIRSRAR